MYLTVQWNEKGHLIPELKDATPRHPRLRHDEWCRSIGLTDPKLIEVEWQDKMRRYRQIETAVKDATDATGEYSEFE